MGRFCAVICSIVVLSACTATPPSITEFLPRESGVPVVSGDTYYREGFVIAPKTFANNHGASLVELSGGKILISWFAGKKEGSADSRIYTTTYSPSRGTYSSPTTPKDGQVSAGSLRETKTVGNSVLYKDDTGRVWLFFNVTDGGWSVATVRYRISYDDGEYWTPVENFISSPGNLVRNKPVAIASNSFLVPLYGELFERKGYACRIDGQKLPPLVHCGAVMNKSKAIQPALIRLHDGKIVALLRDKNKVAIQRSFSVDNGRTWSSPEPTNIANGDTSVASALLPSGKILIAYNSSPSGRFVLSLALSEDEGRVFKRIKDLESSWNENDEFSYPELISASDGMIHIVYTYRRETIKHVIFNESWLKSLK